MTAATRSCPVCSGPQIPGHPGGVVYILPAATLTPVRKDHDIMTTNPTADTAGDEFRRIAALPGNRIHWVEIDDRIDDTGKRQVIRSSFSVPGTPSGSINPDTHANLDDVVIDLSGAPND